VENSRFERLPKPGFGRSFKLSSGQKNFRETSRKALNFRSYLVAKIAVATVHALSERRNAEGSNRTQGGLPEESAK
jgi:hypothetical protein